MTCNSHNIKNGVTIFWCTPFSAWNYSEKELQPKFFCLTTSIFEQNVRLNLKKTLKLKYSFIFIRIFDRT